MSKELPYFRFTVSEWLANDISIEDYRTKGTFIDICSYYWVKDCAVTEAELRRRFKEAAPEIDKLIEASIIKRQNDSEFIKISFLDSQYDTLSEERIRRQQAGRKGGLKNSTNTDEHREKGDQLYIILLSNESERFLKVGITSSSIAQRYSVNMPYKIEVIYQLFDKKNYLPIETEIDRTVSPNYLPLNKFAGYLECYSIDCLDSIVSVIERMTGHPCVIDKRRLTIGESTLNYRKPYKDKDKDKDNNKDKDNYKEKELNPLTKSEISSDENISPEKTQERKPKNASKKKIAGGEPKKEFPDQIVDLFTEVHGSYKVTTPGQERKMAGKIASLYREKHPDSKTENALADLRVYFELCCNIQDAWLRDNMSLSIIVSKYNVINKIIYNGKSSNRNGATAKEIAQAVAKNFATDYTGAEQEHGEDKKELSMPVRTVL